MTRYLVVLAALAWLAMSGCRRGAPPAPQSASRPPDLHATVDFSGLFVADPSGLQRSVTADVPDGFMRRVLLSPNLVFESSRATVAEGATVGPSEGSGAEPHLGNALGAPIGAEYSSLLMRQLHQRGSQMIAPAILRRWCHEDDACAAASWVERALLLTATDRLGADAPTAALAVRELGWAGVRVRVIVDEERSGGQVRVALRPASSAGTSGRCPSLELPVVAYRFSAELLALPSGEVVARIDERRPVAIPPEAATVTVRHSTTRAIEARDGLGRSYVESYRPEHVLCDEIAGAYDRMLQGVGSRASLETLIAMVAEALAPLYRSGARTGG